MVLILCQTDIFLEFHRQPFCIHAGEEPSAFPQRRLKLDLSRVNTSSKLQSLLEGLLEPAWEDRLTVKQAQAVLTGHSSSQRAQRAEQARARPSFGDWGWSNPRDRSAQSSRNAQVAVCRCVSCQCTQSVCINRLSAGRVAGPGSLHSHLLCSTDAAAGCVHLRCCYVVSAVSQSAPSCVMFPSCVMLDYVSSM